ncbi:head-tail adaptor protein [Maritalea mediterranea]|uniref:Head-tail adaptor protein n=1 Tax=Maritalea mediterranea TaxID=2909667 RepID=A0ABS9E838_9HYPH|nr:head-tail adaptor protein [Maritalea mediterranea]MCF4097935.1 head-tail adaptor protein [Maritalea mediterranea]
MSTLRKQPSLASLRNRVLLWRLIDTPDAAGGTDFTLNSLGQSWARIEVSGNGSGAGAGKSRAAQFEFTLRHDPQLANGDLIEWQGAHYQIEHIENLNRRNAYLICTATHIEMEGAHYG